MDIQISIPIEKIIKSTKETLRMRLNRTCTVYIPALGREMVQILNPETTNISLEFSDNGDIICRNDERYEITIKKFLPEEYQNFNYGKLRKMFHIVKLDLIDDDSIEPAISSTVYLYYKI